MRHDIDQLASVIQDGSGNPKQGKPLFMQHCGRCHRLFGEGGDVGPNLTSFQRNDLQRVLVSVVNPSAEIREGFENHLLFASDGRIVNGFLADQDSQVVVLRGVDGQNLIFRREEIDEMRGDPSFRDARGNSEGSLRPGDTGPCSPTFVRHNLSIIEEQSERRAGSCF